jgi:hypothetical protein
MAPIKPTVASEEEVAAHALKARAARGRFDSNGSTRNAFYANPMPEPYARRKRGTPKPNLTTADIDAMDFSSVVNMAIEQEGGADQLTALVGTRPAASLKDFRQRSAGDVMKTPTEGTKIRRQKRASADATIPSEEQRKYGTLRASPKEKKPDRLHPMTRKRRFFPLSVTRPLNF